MTVALGRDYPAAPLPYWQANALGVQTSAAFTHHQQGHFLSPAAWVDHWDVRSADGGGDSQTHRLRFTQLVTLADSTTTRLAWRVSRDFAVDDSATSTAVQHMFGNYYRRLAVALSRMQAVVDRDGPRREVNVSADEAGVRVRGIVRAMLDEEGGPATGRR